MTKPSSNQPPQAIIMAAGQGKRMGSDLPKVLHPVADRPMIHWVVDACRAAGVGRCVVVVGHQAHLVQEALAAEPDIVFAHQRELRGTAHAVLMTRPLFEDQGEIDIFVLAGDGPLIRAQTLKSLLETHRAHGAAVTMATSVLDDPTGYGRIVRDRDGGFLHIVEEKDASSEEKAIREVNPSYYCFGRDDLFEAVDWIEPHNAQGEYYLTDAPQILQRLERVVQVVDAVPPQDVLSINTPQQLAEVDRILRQRLNKEQP